MNSLNLLLDCHCSMALWSASSEFTLLCNNSDKTASQLIGSYRMQCKLALLKTKAEWHLMLMRYFHLARCTYPHDYFLLVRFKDIAVLYFAFIRCTAVVYGWLRSSKSSAIVFYTFPTAFRKVYFSKSQMIRAIMLCRDSAGRSPLSWKTLSPLVLISPIQPLFLQAINVALICSNAKKLICLRLAQPRWLLDVCQSNATPLASHMWLSAVGGYSMMMNHVLNKLLMGQPMIIIFLSYLAEYCMRIFCWRR